MVRIVSLALRREHILLRNSTRHSQGHYSAETPLKLSLFIALVEQLRFLDALQPCRNFASADRRSHVLRTRTRKKCSKLPLKLVKLGAGLTTRRPGRFTSISIDRLYFRISTGVIHHFLNFAVQHDYSRSLWKIFLFVGFN